MKRVALKTFGVILAGACLMAAGVGAKGLLIIQARPDQTTASTKLLSVRNAAGTEKVSADIEGDLVCNDLTVNGSFTLPSTNFASGLTINTDAAALASTGNLRIGTSGASKFTVAAASGNTVVAGTADITGATTITGAVVANGGISGDSSTWSIADTTGVITTTGLANLNGGIAVDTSNFTVSGTTGAVVAAGGFTSIGAAISGTSLGAIKGVMTFTSSATNVESIAANTEVDTDITLAGVAVGDLVFLTDMSVAKDSGVTCDGIAASGKIVLRCYNVTAGAVDPANKTYSFVIVDMT